MARERIWRGAPNGIGEALKLSATITFALHAFQRGRDTKFGGEVRWRWAEDGGGNCLAALLMLADAGGATSSLQILHCLPCLLPPTPFVRSSGGWRHTNPTCWVHHFCLSAPPKSQIPSQPSKHRTNSPSEPTHLKCRCCVAGLDRCGSGSQENQASPVEKKKLWSCLPIATLLCSVLFALSGERPKLRFLRFAFSSSYQPKQNPALNLKPGMQPHHKPAPPKTPKPLTFRNANSTGIGRQQQASRPEQRGRAESNPNQPCMTPCLISPPQNPRSQPKAEDLPDFFPFSLHHLPSPPPNRGMGTGIGY